MAQRKNPLSIYKHHHRKSSVDINCIFKQIVNNMNIVIQIGDRTHIQPLLQPEKSKKVNECSMQIYSKNYLQLSMITQRNF